MGADRGALLDFAFDVGAASDLDEFRAVVTAGIAALVGCDLASYTEIDLASHRAIALVDRPVADLDEVQRALGRLAHQHPLITRTTGRAEMISDYLNARQFARLELYADVYRQLGARDQIAVNLPAGPRRAIGVALNRSRPTFTANDRDTLDLLRPLLVRGYAQARARERGRELTARLARAGEHGAGVVACAADGRVQYASDRAHGLMRKYGVGVSGTARIPKEVPATIAGDCGTLEILPALGAAGELLLELRETPPGSLLTDRERQVLGRVAAGDSNGEIADALGISRSTVQNHLQSIYRKLDVTTRTAAVAALG